MLFIIRFAYFRVMHKYLIFLFVLISACQNSGSNYSEIESTSENIDNDLNNDGAREGQNYSAEETSSADNGDQDDGRVSCPTCSGNTQLECDDCDGKGRRHCRSCGGDGWDSDGNRCLNCEGGGIVSCPTMRECPSCKGYGYGYLSACTICQGTAKNENGEPCSCTSMFHDVIGGLFGMMALNNGNDDISRNLKGISMKDHPGYLFYAPE
jgi:RecJ-like exonuclease